MSALDLVKRWTSGVALRINALIFPGATAGHVLTVVSDGHGGTEVVPAAPSGGGGGGGGLAAGLTVGSMVRWNGTAWEDLPHGREQAQLQMKSGLPRWHDESPYGYCLRYESAAVNGVDLYDVPNANPSPSSLVTTLHASDPTGGGTSLVAAGGSQPTYQNGGSLRFGTSKEMRCIPDGDEFPIGTVDCTVVLIGSNWNTSANQLFLQHGDAATGPTGPCTAWGLGTLSDGSFGWRGGASDEESFGENPGAEPAMLIAYIRATNQVALSFNGAGFSGEHTHSYNIDSGELVVGHGFDLLALLVFDHVIDDGERSQLQRYARTLGVDVDKDGGGDDSGGGPSALHSEIPLPIRHDLVNSLGGVTVGTFLYDPAEWQAGGTPPTVKFRTRHMGMVGGCTGTVTLVDTYTGTTLATHTHTSPGASQFHETDITAALAALAALTPSAGNDPPYLLQMNAQMTYSDDTRAFNWTWASVVIDAPLG